MAKKCVIENRGQDGEGLYIVQHGFERGLILLKGAVPGPKGGLVFIHTAVKEVQL